MIRWKFDSKTHSNIDHVSMETSINKAGRGRGNDNSRGKDNGEARGRGYGNNGVRGG
nr:2282_t:CDS:2 [Entrophospora candida]